MKFLMSVSDGDPWNSYQCQRLFKHPGSRSGFLSRHQL
ncbi:hypothetical protein Leryth_009362 [Lithospermum erythrorhizon]|nr:hypothetical protein Leryth_009362 [Lithospermum erythrorhizon]